MPIDQVALTAFLEAEDGPVGLYVERLAEHTADIARENAAFILARMPEPHLSNVVDNVDYELEGTTTYVVGIRDGGKIERYLADKELRESVWLVPAAEYVFGSE